MPSVLVVEYIKVCRMFYERLLKHSGFTVTMVETREEAAGLVSTGGEFDVIILNLSTPTWDGPRGGIASTRMLRSMNVKSKLVGICVGNESESEYGVVIEAGLDICFPVPLSFARIAKIMELLENDSSSD